MRGNSTLLDNLVINTSDASSKAFGKSGTGGKTIDGFDWWSISCLGDRFNKANKNLGIATSLYNLWHKTEIRMIEFDVNGCGDDGGIEEVRLYDENDTEIKLGIECLSLSLNKAYNSNVYSWDVGYQTNWNTKEKVESVFTKTDVTFANEFVNYINKQLETFNDLFLNGKWKIHSINAQDLQVQLYRNVHNGKHDRVYTLPYVNHYGKTLPEVVNHPMMLAYPDVSVTTWGKLENHCYSQLDGGWEINEGSQNTIQYKLTPSTNPDNEYHVEVSVKQNRNIMEVETLEDTFRFTGSDEKRLRTYLQDELKLNTYAGATLDFNRKADRAKILQIKEWLDKEGL